MLLFMRMVATARGCLVRPGHISARHLRNARRPGISGARWKMRRLE